MKFFYKILKRSFLVASNTLFQDFANKNVIIQRIQDFSISRNTIKERILCMSDSI
jgi:hypothetical protein